MKRLISYLCSRSLLTNVIFFGVIFLSIFIWFLIGKEEMPEFASNWIRVTTVYPGAPAEDVELFITKPLEEELKSVIGLEEVVTTSSLGVSNLRIVIDDDFPNLKEVVTDVKEAILRAKLPAEVREIPRIRQFKSSEKAILDIGIYHQDHKYLDQKSREELQKYILNFESQLLSLKEISSVTRTSYLKPEIQILVDTEKKNILDISLSEIKKQIESNHIRVPVGSMNDRGESKVTALNEYEDVDSFNNLYLRGSYEGARVKLEDLAKVRKGFEKNTSIMKINGHEGVFLNIKKSVSTDILTAQKKVLSFIHRFQKSNKDSKLGIVLMDDESFAVRNRISIISSNGILGFILIVVILFFFMDARSSFWVAMGIPFSMAFTLIVAHLIGYTINNMTLAGIIIVLGIVVDDAIIISENIARKREEGLDSIEASQEGAYEVFKPILASIITTCVAFTPLAFYEGFFGKLVSYIPLVVILMLIGSLFESLFILPSHLNVHVSQSEKKRVNWFNKFEKRYEVFLERAIENRNKILAFFICLIVVSSYLFSTKMKFVMFPREESQEVVVKVKAQKDSVREETARLIEPIENIFSKDTENIVGFRTTIAKSRRGGDVRENEATILVELLPADQRKTPLKKLIKSWERQSANLPKIESVKILKGRWGHDSGSPIEIQILENNDDIRNQISKKILKKLQNNPQLSEVEVEDPLVKKEYLFKIRQNELIKFDVEPLKVTTALRSFVEGSVLYSINKGDEEVDVRLTVDEKLKTDMKELLNLRVENKQGQLISLTKLVKIEEVKRPVNIQRSNFKRSTMIYADIKEDVNLTPIQLAEDLEDNFFPQLTNEYPTSSLLFRGEIEDSRESKGEFLNSVFVVIILIYLILVVMFDSLKKPLVIMSVVPFGFSGIILILLIHGMSVYGFFAAIGALGMIGVVVNDAIVMIDKIEKLPDEPLAKIAATRLRPVILTTLTTVVGLLPTAYGFAGFDSMLSEMMLTMGWGLAFGTCITLLLIPCIYSYLREEKTDV